MLRRLLSSSVAASKYRLLAASRGLSKHGKGPTAERSGVSLVGEDACCVCEAGVHTLLGNCDSGRSHCGSVRIMYLFACGWLYCRGSGRRGRVEKQGGGPLQVLPSPHDELFPCSAEQDLARSLRHPGASTPLGPAEQAGCTGQVNT